jgi:hypothetical protein
MKETHIGVFGANAKRREAYCEIELLSQMRHPNVVRMVKAYQTSAEVQVVMEHAGRDTLLTYLVALDDAEGMTEEEKVNIKHELIRQLGRGRARALEGCGVSGFEARKRHGDERRRFEKRAD